MTTEHVYGKLKELSVKHGIDPEKVIFHEFQQGKFLRWTLHYDVDEISANSSPSPFPFEFLKEFERTLAAKQRRAWERTGGKFEFIDGGRITMAEVMQRQSAFSAHCDLFHLND